MILIHRVGDSITGSYNGKSFGVSYSDEKWFLMREYEQKANTATSMDELKAIIEEFEPLTHESYKELVETASPYLYVNKSTNKFYLKVGDKISSQALPKAFVDRILKSVDKKIDVTPLVKCFARFMRQIPGRPNYSASRAADFAYYIDADFTDPAQVEKLTREFGLSHEVAQERATTKQVAITQEGLLVCYKVSKEILKRYELNEDEDVVQKSRYKPTVDPDTGLVTYDEPAFVEDRLFEPAVMGNGGDEFFSGDKKGHFIRVGKSHWLEKWTQVGPPGGPGLHCGGLTYIKCYQNEGTVTHNVFVDPMDIHSINSHSGDGALTTKRYFVYSSFAGPNRGIYHSSEYAALNDAEFRALLEEVIKATGEQKAELDAVVEEQQALV